MQYYINDSNVYNSPSNLSNKLSYILKKKKISFVKNSDNIILNFNETKLNFIVYLDKIVPQFIMVNANNDNSNINNYINSKLH